jgi:hypothetical protein
MSQVKHNSRGYPLSTQTGMKLVRRWIVQKSGQDLEDVGEQADARVGYRISVCSCAPGWQEVGGESPSR